MQCLESSHKHGLKDMALLLEIGEAYARQGRFHEASGCLCTVIADSNCATYRAFAVLGEAYSECHEFKAAKAAWSNALALATKPGELECAKAALSAMDTPLCSLMEQELISTTPTVKAGAENGKSA